MGSVITLDHHRLFSVRKPKALRRVSRPRRPSASEKVKKWRAGIAPTAFQFDTAGGLTPANFAAAAVPPTASIMEFAFSSMEDPTSNSLNVSSVQNNSIDGTPNLKFRADMPLDREAIIRRLNLLPGVLGKKHFEIAELIGCSPADWANWRSPTGTVPIQPYAALELFRIFRISMDWIYGGEISQTQDQRLRELIVMAEHKRKAGVADRLHSAAATLHKGAVNLDSGAAKLDKAAARMDKTAKKKRPSRRHG